MNHTRPEMFPSLELAELEAISMDHDSNGQQNSLWAFCFEELYPRLLRTASHLLMMNGEPNDQEAPDMVTEGIIRAYDNLRVDEILAHPPDVRLKVVFSYLFTAIRSAVHDHLQNKRRLGPMESLSTLEDVLQSASLEQHSDSIQSARVVALRRLLVKLPPKDMELLNLRLGEGWTLPEIQWYLQETQGQNVKRTTLSMRYRRAFNKLLTFLRDAPEFAGELHLIENRLLQPKKEESDNRSINSLPSIRGF